MKTLLATVALLLAVSMMAPACSRHDDAANQTTANDTLVTDETGNADTLDANVASPDAPLDGSYVGTNAAAPATRNKL